MDGSLEAEMKAAHPAPEQIRALVEVEQHLMADVARCGCCCCVCACVGGVCVERRRRRRESRVRSDKHTRRRGNPETHNTKRSRSAKVALASALALAWRVGAERCAWLRTLREAVASHAHAPSPDPQSDGFTDNAP